MISMFLSPVYGFIWELIQMMLSRNFGFEWCIQKYLYRAPWVAAHDLFVMRQGPPHTAKAH
jgi:hypothetical protein